mmetsp:Transcript_35031/g.61523  ORF Transcript_35031/g.61523 Transcript_35031/m.61523 type:complete len:423 (-) Transcript_35031:162-1430(-)
MGKKSRKATRQKEISAPRVAAASPCFTASESRPPSTECWICLDGDPDDEGKSIVRDCSCRGDDAGFAHLSCLVSYADRKTRDLIESGKGDLLEPWVECPHCRQNYQRQVALDMANSLLSFIDENCPGSEVLKLGGFSMIINTIDSMDYENINSELREEGKRAASQMISAIQESVMSGEDIDNHLMFAYGALAEFSETDKTRDGYEMALHYYEKVRDWNKSVGDEMCAKGVEAAMDRVKSKRDGRKETPFIDGNLKESIRANYERCVREKGENSAATLQAGINLAQALQKSGIHGLECERLTNKLAIISRRVLGPGHDMTLQIENGLNFCRKRRVGMMTDDGVKQYQALRFDEEERKYVVNGPISDPRKSDEEEIMTVAINDIILVPGSPVHLPWAQKCSTPEWESWRYEILRQQNWSLQGAL